MKRRVLIFLAALFTPAGLFAAGPYFQHKAPEVQEEFRKVYDEIANPSATPDPLFVSSAVITNLTANIKGDGTGGEAATGYVGEVVQLVTGNVNYPATGTFGDMGSVSLTAGDWIISAVFITNAVDAGTTFTYADHGVSTTSGNSSSGLVQADNEVYFFNVPSVTNMIRVLTMGPWHVSPATTTTYYLKMRATFTTGHPVVNGKLIATRIR